MGRRIRTYFPVSWKDTGETVLILAAAVGICVLLHRLDASGSYASMVFVLAVMCVARSTSGYLYGILASFFGVVATNYTFTYPYNAFNFTISGYPLTFVVMLAVSILTSTLTTQAKDHERMRRESEKEMLRANLLRAVSHDIRTPLTSILGATLGTAGKWRPHWAGGPDRASHPCAGGVQVADQHGGEPAVHYPHEQ